MAGLKFSSFGAATMPLSKIVVDADLDLGAYSATAATVTATDAVTCHTLTVLAPVAVPSDTIRKTAPNSSSTTVEWKDVATFSIPTEYHAPSYVRVKFEILHDIPPYIAYARIVVGPYTSPEYEASNVWVPVVEDVPIDGATSIIIQLRTSDPQQQRAAYIRNISVGCDDHPMPTHTSVVVW